MIHRLNSPNLAAIFEQQNSSPKGQFSIFACGLACARVPEFHWIDLTAAPQYSIGPSHPSEERDYFKPEFGPSEYIELSSWQQARDRLRGIRSADPNVFLIC
jgi:hypothetical protein